ncbi:hypothetical protein DFA_01934 [Cavenderia fasciculata]|uniref:peptidylprolyl isomerase n=1 Tax=Cavenderia fasciculata TaxID=261658 RepID=F4PQT7_CACFS|nr:uncharacterized protein DFA_01934 [Cavenderia fasciculata]EGG22045.1 hypothetical protein DFA_01934 [Cavenderia fasciculata]|eukprot:XP_004359896.1 hypothetical protein DFA_01934 [Cavenderia fasciculata]
MGIEKEIIKEGNGMKPIKGNMVQLHYTGRLASNNNVFDTSVKKGIPFQFKLGHGKVIKANMSRGEKCRVTITPDRMFTMTFAYAQRTNIPGIPPNSTLIFDMELVGWTQ